MNTAAVVFWFFSMCQGYRRFDDLGYRNPALTSLFFFSGAFVFMVSAENLIKLAVLSFAAEATP